MAGATFLMAAAALAGAMSLSAASRVELRDRIVRLGDVVPGMRGASASIAIAALPAGRRSVALSRAALVSLIRRRLPGSRIDARGAGEIVIAVQPRGLPVRRDCVVVTEPVAKGKPIVATSIAPTACTGAPVAPIAFDRERGVALARVALAPGGYLGRYAPPPAAEVDAGDQLALVSTAGPVRIERQVIAMQSSRGRRVFVRDADGQVYSAPLEGKR